MVSQSIRQRGDRRKRVLAVRAMVAELSWLDGAIVWHDGRVGWRGERGIVVPGPAELALAQRRLYQIRRYPVASRVVLGDAAGWLERRQARLELAKRLQRLPQLAGRAGDVDACPLPELMELLAAEALCINGLPVSIGAALISRGPAARDGLMRLVADASAVPAARALAALALGAIGRRQASAEAFAPLDAGRMPDHWIRDAYAWGVLQGYPAHPALVIALLAEDDGPALAARCVAAVRSGSPFAMPVELVGELLSRVAPAERVVALAEAVSRADSLTPRILQYRDELPERPAAERHGAAERLLGERQGSLTTLARLVCDCARLTADPATIDRVVALGHHLLDLPAARHACIEALLLGVQLGLKLPAEGLVVYVRVLTEQFEAIWDHAGVRRDEDNRLPHTWLLRRQSRAVAPVWNLAYNGVDAGTITAAVQLHMQDVLAGQALHDRELFGPVLELARELEPARESHLRWAICRLVDPFPGAGDARTGLQQLRSAMLPLPPGRRQHLVEEIDIELPAGRAESQQMIRQLAPHLRRIASYVAACPPDPCACRTLIAGAVQLQRAVPEQAAAWLDWLIDEAGRLARRENWDYFGMTALRGGVLLGAALAGGDFAMFASTVRAMARHRSDQRFDLLEAGIAALGQVPDVRQPLAVLAPLQTRRCVDFLVHLALTQRLGANERAPLAALAEAMDDQPPGDGYPAEWQRLLDLAPDLAPDIDAFLTSRSSSGGPPAMPARVLRVVEQPAAMARELAYIERRLREQPDGSGAGLATRASNLRSRLAGAGSLQGAALDDVRERLAQATAEARLGAAECRVLACFRERLGRVAGPLPDSLAMDDDLLNATLLTSDIRSNRRLLRRLLRAHLAGDHGWTRRHPGNVRFLRELAGGGVDVDAWLSAYPRRYPCALVPGGGVHLRLERDPLRILQMGNYFDTCLSFGGGNSFSTVANACELNKRVIFATDGRGLVVGRKLIGINAEGGLVGFHTYTSLHDEASNLAVREIMRRYAAGFARRCGLDLHDAGTVPRLFAEAWYDDGVVPWDEATRDRDGEPAGISHEPDLPAPRPAS